MTRREKQCRRILSTPLLEATVPSNEVSSSSDCENRTGTEKLNDLVLVFWAIVKKGKTTWRFLGWASSHHRKRLAGTSERRPFLISQIKASVFVSARLAMIPGTPCKVRSFTSFQMVHTHTRSGRAEVEPWRNFQYFQLSWQETPNSVARSMTKRYQVRFCKFPLWKPM